MRVYVMIVSPAGERCGPEMKEQGSVRMKEFVTYRLTGRGVWGYEFFDEERNQIGFVRNGLSSSEPVLIEGPGISWYSLFGMDHTIVPGTGRRVKDNQNGQEAFRIIFWQPGLYEVRTAAGESVQAEVRENAYLFGPPQMPATALTQRISEAEWIPSTGYEMEPYFRTVLYEEVSPAFLMMALSFPALRFY